MQSAIAGAADYVDLTPLEPTTLAGFGERTGRSQGVADKIEANAVVLTDLSGRTAVIITFDTLYIGPVLDARLRRFLSDQHGIRSDDVLLLASHSHFAPSLDPTKPNLGNVDIAYLEEVGARCEAMLGRLLAKPQTPLTLSGGTADWSGAVNRRRVWPLPLFGPRGVRWGGTVMAPNPRGPRDRRVRQWTLRSENHAPVAILWSCACHPTGFPKQACITSEYPGRGRDYFRAIHENVPVLFLQGFAGDVRPCTPERRPLWRRVIQALLYGPSFCPFDMATWEKWTADLCSTLGRAKSSADEGGEALLVGTIRSGGVSVPLSTLLCPSDDRPVWMRRLRIGEALDLWAVAAEPSAALAAFLPTRNETVAVGYLGDVFGYWPTARQVSEGGYEGGGFLSAFGMAGKFRSSIDDTFQSMVQKLMKLD